MLLLMYAKKFSPPALFRPPLHYLVSTTGRLAGRYKPLSLSLSPRPSLTSPRWAFTFSFAGCFGPPTLISIMNTSDYQSCHIIIIIIISFSPEEEKTFQRKLDIAVTSWVPYLCMQHILLQRHRPTSSPIQERDAQRLGVRSHGCSSRSDMYHSIIITASIITVSSSYRSAFSRASP